MHEAISAQKCTHFQLSIRQIWGNHSTEDLHLLKKHTAMLIAVVLSQHQKPMECKRLLPLLIAKTQVQQTKDAIFVCYLPPLTTSLLSSEQNK